MSNDLLQMRRSWVLVADEMRRSHPRLEKSIAVGTTGFIAWSLGRAIELRRLRLIPLLGALLASRDLGLAARILIRPTLRGPARRLRNVLRASPPVPAELPRFVIGDPDLGV